MNVLGLNTIVKYGLCCSRDGKFIVQKNHVKINGDFKLPGAVSITMAYFRQLRAQQPGKPGSLAFADHDEDMKILPTKGQDYDIRNEFSSEGSPVFFRLNTAPLVLSVIL